MHYNAPSLMQNPPLEFQVFLWSCAIAGFDQHITTILSFISGSMGWLRGGILDQASTEALARPPPVNFLFRPVVNPLMQA